MSSQSLLNKAKLTKNELARRIRQRAMALGFDQVGILTVADGPIREGEKLSTWLERGYHADMNWMVNHLEKRVNPASLMEGTRSIVCLSINYYVEIPPNPNQDGVKIARYARGSDYHRVIKKRLKALARDIEGWVPGVRTRPLTDSAPLMERPMAVKAGLGWIGKNGMLIHPRRGSYTFLAELLLDIDLGTEIEEVQNHCGTCTRCIDACPTDAIVEPSVVDSNRCIAYWTIESDADQFPESIRKNLSGWVFGCDICQEVCPWNIKFAVPTAVEEFQVRPENENLSAQQLLALTQEGFDKHFRQSPVKRTKREGLQRNVREHLSTI